MNDELDNAPNFSKEYCIIGGFPRAGTRQFSDIINLHPSFNIKGEVYNRSFRLVGQLIQQADIDHTGRWSFEKYKRHRMISAMNMIASVSKGSNRPFDISNRVLGFKSPRIERHKKTLDIVFKDTVSPVYFLFCVRNLKENFLSLKSTFNVEIQQFLQDTIESLNSFFCIEKDPLYTVKVLSLDDFLKADSKGEWINSNIFSNFHFCKLKNKDCDNFYLNTTNRNATVASGKKRIKELTTKEEKLFRKNKELLNAVDKFEKFSGIKLL